MHMHATLVPAAQGVYVQQAQPAAQSLNTVLLGFVSLVNASG